MLAPVPPELGRGPPEHVRTQMAHVDALHLRQGRRIMKLRHRGEGNNDEPCTDKGWAGFDRSVACGAC